MGFTSIRTADGTIIARDPSTGSTASAASLAEAYAELRRLALPRAVHVHAPAHTREADRERAA